MTRDESISNTKGWIDRLAAGAMVFGGRDWVIRDLHRKRLVPLSRRLEKRVLNIFEHEGPQLLPVYWLGFLLTKKNVSNKVIISFSLSTRKILKTYTMADITNPSSASSGEQD